MSGAEPALLAGMTAPAATASVAPVVLGTTALAAPITTTIGLGASSVPTAAGLLSSGAAPFVASQTAINAGLAKYAAGGAGSYAGGGFGAGLPMGNATFTNNPYLTKGLLSGKADLQAQIHGNALSPLQRFNQMGGMDMPITDAIRLGNQLSQGGGQDQMVTSGIKRRPMSGQADPIAAMYQPRFKKEEPQSLFGRGILI